jgi:hypothetical protein
MTFLKCYFISVWELEDLLVWSPVLDLGIFSSSSLENILSQEMLVIEGVEICSFSLVGEFG